MKEDLAVELVARYHGRAAADGAAQEFIRILREKEITGGDRGSAP